MVISKAFALRIDEHLDDVLDVGDFVIGADSDLLERVVFDASFLVGGIEFQAALPHLFARPSRQLPELAFEIVDEGGVPPGGERGYDRAHAFARPGGRITENVPRSAIAEIGATTTAARLPDPQIDAVTRRRTFHKMDAYGQA